MQARTLSSITPKEQLLAAYAAKTYFRGRLTIEVHGNSTASFLAHMLAAARGLQDADLGLKSGRWLKGQIRLGADGGPRPGHELAGKRLGLLGYGRIGKGVARAASALRAARFELSAATA